eukprot:TRINITY_DN90802_c0_g1_i1.p1 TRINITY_DN90802_c0_g1~~TRINITY_DN90802_c0_g1_i1.p1  ORF type:complete len:364 (+),score=44.55 TRINITY_DN90802_c0_g1_i1:159-1094(+)
MAAEQTSEPRLVHTLMGSSMSGLLSRIPCHPLDTIKSRLQSATGSQYRGILHCFRSTLAEEGILGLYRGFGVVALLGTPAACVYLSSYELLKSALAPKGSELAFLGHFWSGMGAEAAACLIFVPVDVVKERLQVQGPHDGLHPSRVSAPPTYHGSLDALRVISRTEGIFGLYKGYFATLGSFGPFSALYFVFYEQARAMLAQATGSSNTDSLPAALTLTASAGAGCAASVATCPLDLAKLRLQTQRKLLPGEAVPVGHLRGFQHALQVVWQEAGFWGLFRGAGARAAFHAPSTCITFTTFEECRKVAQAVI